MTYVQRAWLPLATVTSRRNNRSNPVACLLLCAVRHKVLKVLLQRQARPHRMQTYRSGGTFLPSEALSREPEETSPARKLPLPPAQARTQLETMRVSLASPGRMQRTGNGVRHHLLFVDPTDGQATC